MCNIRAHLVCAVVMLAFACFSADFASAAECRLTRVASLDMTIDKGKIFIPVTIQGASKLMAVDTGAPLTTIDPDVAQEIGIERHRIYQGMMYTSTGEQFTQMGVAHGFDIGQLHAPELRALIEPSSFFGDKRIAGLLGADFLRHYDIDLDFANGKLNVFSQDHCPGKVVYWPAQAVAAIPMKVEQTGHIVVPVSLDGQQLDALFDTGAAVSILSQETAEGTFGLKPNSPGMRRAGEFDGSSDIPVYAHTFKTLDLEGIAIANPTLYIWENQAKYAIDQRGTTGTRLGGIDERSGLTPIVFGLNEMRPLHIYIAYGEQKLYVTPGSAAPEETSKTTTTMAPGETSGRH